MYQCDKKQYTNVRVKLEDVERRATVYIKNIVATLKMEKPKRGFINMISVFAPSLL